MINKYMHHFNQTPTEEAGMCNQLLWINIFNYFCLLCVQRTCSKCTCTCVYGINLQACSPHLTWPGRSLQYQEKEYLSHSDEILRRVRSSIKCIHVHSSRRECIILQDAQSGCTCSHMCPHTPVAVGCTWDAKQSEFQSSIFSLIVSTRYS